MRRSCIVALQTQIILFFQFFLIILFIIIYILSWPQKYCKNIQIWQWYGHITLYSIIADLKTWDKAKLWPYELKSHYFPNFFLFNLFIIIYLSRWLQKYIRNIHIIPRYGHITLYCVVSELKTCDKSSLWHYQTKSDCFQHIFLLNLFIRIYM